jgi:hypothetical protein
MYEAGERCDIRQTAMSSPTVTELTRGTAHPEPEASRDVLVALSPVVRLGRRNGGSSAGQHASHTSDPAHWRGQQAA